MDVNCYKHINLEYMDMMSDGDDSMKKIMLEMLLEELPQEKNIEILAKDHETFGQIPPLVQKLKDLYPNTISELSLELEKL